MTLTLSLSLSLSLLSQKPFSSFRWPVDIPVTLTGNFGELRMNHFHYGLDLSTNGKEGIKIFAIADGHVSRVKVSTTGYGKVVYIDHPNGVTSVYAHLRQITGPLGALVKKHQYEKENFEIEYFPKPGEFPVSKGMLLGESGNSGLSSGPHLHFELRCTATEKVLNPCLFGFNVPDTVPPVFMNAGFETSYPDGFINNISSTQRFPLIKKKGVYSLKITDTVRIQGRVGITVNAWDMENRNSGKNGVYKMEVFLDGKKIYLHQLDSFSFTEARYANSHMDYARYIEKGELHQRCFTQKCNEMSIYKFFIDNGRLNITENKVYHVQVVAYDYNGNSSTLSFPIKGSPVETLAPQMKKKVDCNEPHLYETEDLRVKFPVGTFYTDLYEGLPLVSVQSGTVTWYSIVNSGIPAHEAFELSIRCDKIPPAMEKKICLVRKSKNGISYAGGEYKNGWVTGSFKTFGLYSVAIDSLSPFADISSVNGKTVAKGGRLSLSVTDKLSGIKTWKLVINGKWYLSEYEPKKDVIFFYTNDLAAGKHSAELEIADQKENIKKVKFSFVVK